MPGAQPRQAAEEALPMAGRNVPAAQLTQLADRVSGWYWPVVQLAQATAPAVAENPTAHGAHAAPPDAAWY